MVHLFRATKLGWDNDVEGIWFDADQYTEEEARAQIKTYEGITQEGYPYTGYEFDGQKYHDVRYVGLFENDELPENDAELMEFLMKRNLQ